MKINLPTTFACLTVSIAITSFTLLSGKDDLIRKNFQVAEKQYSQLLEASTDLTKFPRTTDPEGNRKSTGVSDWTGGFWAGGLWYLYEYTNDPKWKTAATKWTEALALGQYNTIHHDAGFVMYTSYGNGYRLTKNPDYKKVLIQSAESLASRFDPKVGSIKSWNPKASWDGHMWNYPVIMDNMMNLELLFFATKASGDPKYRKIAIRHADNSLRDHIRPDYSSYHVVNYDPATGKVLDKQANQGFSDNSTWARGQAWGIYGFTLMYRETRDKRYLEAARKMADFYLGHQRLPKDKVPYWDFDVNQPGFVPDWKYDQAKYPEIYRDASAAAIVSSALFELSSYVGEGRKKYNDAAVAILQSLSSEEYLAKPGTNNFFLLKHSVGSLPHGSELDVPLIYADYYFLEAMLRYRKGL